MRIKNAEELQIKQRQRLKIVILTSYNRGESLGSFDAYTTC